MNSDTHIVRVAILTLVSQTGVELDHLVIAVEGHLVAAQLDRQQGGQADHQLAQLFASVDIRHHHILQSTNAATAVDKLPLHDHGGCTNDESSSHCGVLNDYHIIG